MSTLGLPGALRRFTAPLATKIRLMVSRGVVNLVNDALKCQGLQIELLKDEVIDDVERFQEYGFTSVPLVGAEVLFLSVGGNRSAGVVVCATDRRYRPTGLNEGDVALFTVNGVRVYLDKENDVVNIGAKSAADFVALATETNSRLDALEDFAATHTHILTIAAASGSGGTGTAAPAASSPSGNSVAASKVKAT